jgi:hypothetical protein
MSAAASAMDLRECALRAIADDYEEFGKIFDDVSAWLTERGTSTTRMATRQALEGLIREGYAQAYVLAAERSDAQPVFLESDRALVLRDAGWKKIGTRTEQELEFIAF